MPRSTRLWMLIMNIYIYLMLSKMLPSAQTHYTLFIHLQWVQNNGRKTAKQPNVFKNDEIINFTRLYFYVRFRPVSIVSWGDKLSKLSFCCGHFGTPVQFASFTLSHSPPRSAPLCHSLCTHKIYNFISFFILRQINHSQKKLTIAWHQTKNKRKGQTKRFAQNFYFCSGL